MVKVVSCRLHGVRTETAVIPVAKNPKASTKRDGLEMYSGIDNQY
jgi:hypothetical protein